MRFLRPKTIIPNFFFQSTTTAHSTTRFCVGTRRAMSSLSTPQRLFQLKLDPLTGNSEWVVIKEEEEADDEASHLSPKPLLATTSYLDMLNDSRRNRVFREAIDKIITKPCHVLDIGAGTGLLSMMAARAMDSGDSTVCSNSNGMVTACESYLPMVKLMRKVLRANCMQTKIRVFNKRSDELEIGVDIASRANVLVSEILDSELLGEGLIPTLQHAHDNLLVENPQTVPFRATIYGQLVESAYLWKLHDLHSNEMKTLDDMHLVPNGMEMILCTKPQQFAMHCDAMKDEVKLLSEPFKIFEFDFWRRPESQEETQLLIKATNDGTVHAVVSWWMLQLDSEGTIFYSTSPKWNSYGVKVGELESSFPGPENWCDHWKQCVWFIPGKGLSISKHQEVHLRAIHSETSISYELKTEPQRTGARSYNFNAQVCQLIFPPERIAIYGDRNWRHSILKAIKNALQWKNSPLCVVADDSVFLSVAIVSLCKTSHLISIFPGLGEKGSEYLRAVAVANGYSMDRVEVVKRKKQLLTMCDTHQRKVDILVGEPFYYGNDGLLPWQNLRFWKERTMLEPVLSEDALIMPCKGILKACAMYLPDLWKSRCCLKEIEGFDHLLVNATLGACGNLPGTEEGPCLPFFIWQCGQVKELSDTVTLMEFNLLKPISSCYGKVQIQFTGPGICHGLVFWVDWVMDTENCVVLSTGPDQRYWKQGVKLLSEPVAVATHRSNVGEYCSVEIQAGFESSSGDLVIQHAFS